MRMSLLMLAIVLLACTSDLEQNHTTPPGTLDTITPVQTPVDSSTITIATFNIRILGKTKAKKPEVMSRIAAIMQKYDLIAVQEIKDKTGSSADSLLAWLNRDSTSYGMLISQRTGNQPDDKNSMEQYAYYFRTSTITVLDSGLLYNDSVYDLFQREPFIARFQATQGNFTFAVASIHTRPQSAVEEIAALDTVNKWISTLYPDEDDIITLGDFNASCRYASTGDLNSLSFRDTSYYWIVPDSANTNLSKKPCAYDRIVITKGATNDFTGTWAVDRSFTDPAISDHWPVWASFYCNRD